MRVLLTGAGGFLGRHVAERLVADGFEVTGFDIQPRGPHCHEWIEGDLRDLASLSEAARDHQVICHIGAIGDVYLAGARPSLATEVNAAGSANVAAAAESVGARVVYASTWEVYGEPRYEPMDERHPCAPSHPYSITKLAGEQLLLAADRLQGVPVLSLRLGTAYGLGLRPNSVFRMFIDKAKRGEPITIHGSGLQGRQFTDAQDLAAAFSTACGSDLHGIALNVLAPEIVTIKELAQAVVERYPTELSFGEPRHGEPEPARVSTEKAREMLGWEATVPFDVGIARLMDDLDQKS